jgi:hypothetical protein
MVLTFLNLHSGFCQGNSDGFGAGSDEVFLVVHTGVRRATGQLFESTTQTPKNGNWDGVVNQLLPVSNAPLTEAVDLQQGDAVTHYVTLWEENDEGTRQQLNAMVADVGREIVRATGEVFGVSIPETASDWLVSTNPWVIQAKFIVNLLFRDNVLLGSGVVMYGFDGNALTLRYAGGPGTEAVNEPAAPNNFLMRFMLRGNYLLRFNLGQ